MQKVIRGRKAGCVGYRRRWSAAQVVSRRRGRTARIRRVVGMLPRCITTIICRGRVRGVGRRRRMGAEVRVICCRRLVGLIVCVFAIVCGGLWRFVAVCGGLWRFVAVFGGPQAIGFACWRVGGDQILRTGAHSNHGHVIALQVNSRGAQCLRTRASTTNTV
jgi:hypothetical protein